MLKPQEAVNLIANNSKLVEWHGLDWWGGKWRYAVKVANQTFWFEYPSEIDSVLSNYYEDDRIDDIFVEDGDLFVSVNHGNVGSRTILERSRLGKCASSVA